MKPVELSGSGSVRVRRAVLVAACVLLAAAPTIGYAQAPARLTLQAALIQALRASPELQAQEAEVQGAEARLIGARVFQFNPDLGGEVGDRTGGTSSTDFQFSLEQEIEIGGQRGKRTAVAQAALKAARSRLLRTRRLLAAEVEIAFSDTLRDRELVKIAETNDELAQSLLRFATRRLEAGAATQIELNLARATAGRAGRARRLAQAAHVASRSRLAEITALRPEDPPEVEGELPESSAAVATLGTLLDDALRNRADLVAQRLETESAAQGVRLAKALGVPNPRLGAFYSEEESTDTIKGLSLVFPLPIFQRNQGEVAESVAFSERQRAEVKRIELAVRQQVTSTRAMLEAAVNSAEELRSLVVGTFEESLTFLERALAAGKIGATDVLVLQQQFVASQQEYVEAVAEAWVARVELDLATGSLPLPDPVTGEMVSPAKGAEDELKSPQPGDRESLQ